MPTARELYCVRRRIRAEESGRKWTNCRIPQLLMDRIIMLAEDSRILAPWEVIERCLDAGAAKVMEDVRREA